jgi:type IV pilus assembly protein PilZ
MRAVTSAHRTSHRYPGSLRVAFSPSAGSFDDETMNVSAGGMFVRTRKDLPVGTLVSVALEIPDGERPAPVRAQVVHVAPPGAGMRFVEIGDASRARIDHYIESLVKSRAPSTWLLSVARDLLEKKGWTQLTEREPGGSFCLSGALLAAAGDDDEAYQAALRTLGPRLNVPACERGGFGCHCAVVRWNDAEGRNKYQVIAKLDEVIDAELGSAPRAT